jgi:transposase
MNENTASYTAFCGIDISKDSFDYCLLNQSKQIICHDKLPMTLDSLNHIKRIAESDVNQNTIFTMESTGKYHRRVSNFLVDNGFDVSVLQPLLIKKYNESKDLRKTKTDKKDAKLIAEYAVDNHNTLYLYDSGYDALKELSRFRQSLVRALSSQKTSFKEMMVSIFPELVSVKKDFIYRKTILYLLRECCIPGNLCKKRVTTLEKMLKRCKAVRLSITAAQLKEMAKTSIGVTTETSQFIITELIDDILEKMSRIEKVEAELEKQSSGKYKEEIEIITSIKGIGESTAISFLIETKDLSLFSDWKKLSAYAGIDPSISQSGSSVNKKGKISKRGNKYLRSTLFLMAASVFKHSERYGIYYQKKRDEGKEYKKTIIAIANKLLKLIYSLLKKGEFYDPNYEKKLSLERLC